MMVEWHIASRFMYHYHEVQNLNVRCVQMDHLLHWGVYQNVLNILLVVNKIISVNIIQNDGISNIIPKKPTAWVLILNNSRSNENNITFSIQSWYRSIVFV